MKYSWINCVSIVDQNGNLIEDKNALLVRYLFQKVAGPAVKVKIGKKIGYERDSFLQWLRGKMKHDAPHVKKENTFHYMPDSTPFRTF